MYEPVVVEVQRRTEQIREIHAILQEEGAHTSTYTTLIVTISTEEHLLGTSGPGATMDPLQSRIVADNAAKTHADNPELIDIEYTGGTHTRYIYAIAGYNSGIEEEIIAELRELSRELLAHLTGTKAQTTREEAIAKARHILRGE